ncbi:hypothetical protein ZHAS_00012326 [Anopheles sinensis]|uniref:Uncharacterized protein n=1 Tax=Anopheles sinensis TaxID=74873 RepID=A0A084W2D9_ANOSI|nr:hypothetical protein ZHAS_00012326 [Anopheles sinensis]
MTHLGASDEDNSYWTKVCVGGSTMLASFTQNGIFDSSRQDLPQLTKLWTVPVLPARNALKGLTGYETLNSCRLNLAPVPCLLPADQQDVLPRFQRGFLGAFTLETSQEETIQQPLRHWTAVGWKVSSRLLLDFHIHPDQPP